MESSIYADLRKYAGEIKAKKIEPEPEPVKSKKKNAEFAKMLVDGDKNSDGGIDKNNDKNVDKNSDGGNDKNPKKQKLEDGVKPQTGLQVDSQLTIDNIVAKIAPTMTAVKDANGFIHDGSTIAAKCPRGHIHRYFIKDIETINCITCNSGNKFCSMVRELVETTLGVPFVYIPKTNYTYTNPILKINITCAINAGIDTVDNSNDQLNINLHPTTSLKKVKTMIMNFIGECKTLDDNQRGRVMGLVPKTEKTKPFKKDPLPFTPELANQVQVPANTSNPQLYIENC